jgi:hypothetical protein
MSDWHQTVGLWLTPNNVPVVLMREIVEGEFELRLFTNGDNAVYVNGDYELRKPVQRI